jgi:hypothetical protein
MLFWAGILTGGLFIWLAIKIGFYEIFIILFDAVISVYVSIFLTPVLSDIIPAAKDTSFYYTFSLATVAIGTFIILYTIAYLSLTGRFKVAFHKTFEILFAGILGFLLGFLVFSFAALVITVTPLSQNRFISKIGFNKLSQQANISYICWWCDMVNTVAYSDEKIQSKSIVDELLKDSQIKDNGSKPKEKPAKLEEPDDALR